MKPYNHEEDVVVRIQVRKHGRTRVREDRYRKSRRLKSVTFTLGTDSPTDACNSRQSSGHTFAHGVAQGRAVSIHNIHAKSTEFHTGATRRTRSLPSRSLLGCEEALKCNVSVTGGATSEWLLGCTDQHQGVCCGLLCVSLVAYSALSLCLASHSRAVARLA